MKKRFFLPNYTGHKPLNFSNPWLAPLAGYSDLPFRLLCRQYGATICETEMVSAKGLIYRGPGTGELLLSTYGDDPLIVQLFGSEPAELAEALLTLRKAGYRHFDCNMGCPVRKVLKQRAGASLMADLPRATEIARAMIAAANATGRDLPDSPALVGFKLRLPPKGSVLDFGKYLEDAGASWLTLHPRTASQGYGGKADWEQIAQLVQTVQIPVIASGDLFTAEAGINCLKKTGCKTVMYARGSLHNPFIFYQHDALSKNLPLPVQNHSAMRQMITTHIALARQSFNEPRAFGKMRSLLPRYARGLRGIRELRADLCMCADWASLEEVLNHFWDGAINENNPGFNCRVLSGGEFGIKKTGNSSQNETGPDMHTGPHHP